MYQFSYLKLSTALLLVLGYLTPLMAQNKFDHSPADLSQIKILKAKVEASPANLQAHHAFINTFKIEDPALEEQYKIWIKQYPKVFTIPFAIGELYVHKENPKGAPYLLQASILKPNDAATYFLLANDAAFKKNVAAQQKYLEKATQYDPYNPDYAFYYASSVKDTDPIRYDSLSIEVVRRFPDSERGAQALYWLASNSTIEAEQMAYYKQLYNRKSNQLSNWYLEGMTKYFDLLLNTDPKQAFELALTMNIEGKRNRNLWKDRIIVADAFLKSRKLLIEGKSEQALVILNKVDLGNPALGSEVINAKETLMLFKAEAADAAKQTALAYDSLAIFYSNAPSDKSNQALFIYGCKLGIDSVHVAASIRKIRNSTAKLATDFSLQNYLSPGKTRLSDYRGKVVLLTYWFPGCAPCRAEFLYFESVIKKFKNTEIAYLGLNLYPSQDAFVLPFLKESGYSFIPLRDDETRAKGNLSVDGAPTNYLIDQRGRIVFSGFRIDKENERTLELMIKETLNSKD